MLKKQQRAIEDLAKLDTEIKNPSPQIEEVKQPDPKPKPVKKSAPTDKDNLQSEESEIESSKSSEPDLDQMDDATRTAYLEKQLRMLKQKEADAKLVAEY